MATPGLALDQYCGPHDPVIAAAIPQVTPWTNANTPVGDIIELNATNGWELPAFGCFVRLPVEYSTTGVAGSEAIYRRYA